MATEREISVRALTGAELDAALPDLARLRIAVFRAFPYLYDGDEAYEAAYLREFAAAPHAALIAALDGDMIVGAATASPLSAQKPEFQEPFATRGINVTKTFYFGESVLLPDYRGRGIGHAFFDAREDAARAAGATSSCFCAVIRAADHPQRPADYRPLDGFWRARGYSPVEGFVTNFDWAEASSPEEIPHAMQYWMRAL